MGGFQGAVRHSARAAPHGGFDCPVATLTSLRAWGRTRARGQNGIESLHAPKLCGPRCTSTIHSFIRRRPMHTTSTMVTTHNTCHTRQPCDILK